MGSSSWEQRCTRTTPAYGTRKQRCLNAPTGTPPTPTPPVLTVFVRGRPGAVSPLGVRLPGVRRGGRQSLPPLMSTRGGGDSHYPAVPPTWVVPCSRARLFCFVLDAGPRHTPTLCWGDFDCMCTHACPTGVGVVCALHRCERTRPSRDDPHGAHPERGLIVCNRKAPPSPALLALPAPIGDRVGMVRYGRRVSTVGDRGGRDGAW